MISNDIYDYMYYLLMILFYLVYSFMELILDLSYEDKTKIKREN